jgi:acyl carrier protein
MEYSKMHDIVYHFIKSNFLFDDRKILKDDDSLLGSGIIDSTGVLELISFLEKEFSISFEDNELTGENFDSISKIISFLLRKINEHK